MIEIKQSFNSVLLLGILIVFTSSCKNNSTDTNSEENEPPKITMTKEVKALPGESVSVSANASDPNDDHLEYEWELFIKPDDSNVEKNITKDSTLNFKPDFPGKYKFNIKVSDGEFEKNDTLTITTQYPLGSGINKKTTLTDQYEYRITEPLTINAPLIIQPNTHIFVGSPNQESNNDIIFMRTGNQGQIVAKGTDDSPITISGLNDNPWAGIAFPYSINSKLNTLEHVNIKDVFFYQPATEPSVIGDALGTLFIAGKASLKNVTLESTLDEDALGSYPQTSLYIERRASIEQFEQNSFDENIKIAVNHLPILDNEFDLDGEIYLLEGDADSVILKNFGNRYVGHIGGNLKLEQNVEYKIGTINIPESNTLEMDEGSSLIINNGSLNIRGNIIAQGTDTNPVSFTSSTSEKGSWHGIQLYSQENKLDHTHINYGGGGSAFSRANIVLHENANLDITNSVIGESSGWGIWVSQGSELTESNNEFENCDLGTIGYEE